MAVLVHTVKRLRLGFFWAYAVSWLALVSACAWALAAQAWGVLLPRAGVAVCVAVPTVLFGLLNAWMMVAKLWHLVWHWSPDQGLDWIANLMVA